MAKQTKNKYETQEAKFKGHRVLSIQKNGLRLITVGKTKAEAILENIDAIREFVQNVEKKSAVKISEIPKEKLTAIKKIEKKLKELEQLKKKIL